MVAGAPMPTLAKFAKYERVYDTIRNYHATLPIVPHEETRRTYPYFIATLLALALGASISFALTEAGSALVATLWQKTGALTYRVAFLGERAGGSVESPYARLSAGSVVALSAVL